MTARLVVDAGATLGECPLWCERGQVLYWTDIEAGAISAWDGTSVRRWELPERVGSFALCSDGHRLLLGMVSGVALFDARDGSASPIVPVERAHGRMRINDGRCDPQGRFVFGMFHHRSEPLGHFFRVGADLRIEKLPLPPATVANSIAFSPDGETMYFADSPTRTIWCANYHADGRVDGVREFVRLREGEGYPDGSCVDSEGGLWNAQWQGSCVVRYGADGRETDRLALPVSQVTCPAFGGAGLDRMFVTSARIALDDKALAQEPLAGGVFELQPGRRGMAEHRFVVEA